MCIFWKNARDDEWKKIPILAKLPQNDKKKRMAPNLQESCEKMRRKPKPEKNSKIQKLQNWQKCEKLGESIKEKAQKWLKKIENNEQKKCASMHKFAFSKNSKKSANIKKIKLRILPCA